MKYNKYLLVLIIFHAFNASAQNLIDPYRLNYLNPVTLMGPTPDYFVERGNPIQHINVYNSGNASFNLSSSAYDGEYMIILEPSAAAYPQVWHKSLRSFGITYKIESVSFPFTLPQCWQTGGCGNVAPTNERNLKLPVEIYNNSLGKWGMLCNYKKDGVINPAPTNNYNLLISGLNGNGPERLVSFYYVYHDINTVYIGTNYLPHTVLKHTLYFHCGDINTAIIDSISWVYDNTRGRMRSYPFNYQNVPGSGDDSWDVVYIPEIILKPDNDYYLDPNFGTPVRTSYGEPDNNSWIDGGTLNYFDYYDSPVCSNLLSNTYFPSDHGNNFYLYGQDEVGHSRPPGFSLLSSPLREAGGECLAGYKFDNSNPPMMYKTTFFEGLKHSYFLNRNFDLSIINPSEKIIYNPSEVTLVADNGTDPVNIIFPRDYTFKTILGRYPSVQEVEDALVIAESPLSGTLRCLLKLKW